MDEPAVPGHEIADRIRRLREALGKSRVSAALAIGKVDVLYFAGTPQDGIVWIPREGEAAFLVHRDLARARRESPLQLIAPFSKPSDIPAALAGLDIRIEGPVGTPLDMLPARIHGSLIRALGVPVEDISREVRGVRAVKSAWELERVRAAGVLAGETFAHARTVLRQGMREIDLAAEIAAFLIRSGSVAHYRTRTFNLEFTTLCCIAGESGDLRGPSDSPNGAGRGPHPAFGEGASERRIGRGEPILIDLGTSRGGYYADTTRVFHFGPLPGKFVEAHRASEEILAAAVEGIEARRPLQEIYARALATAAAAGLSAEFMGGSRFLGHGVGLEIDEVPVVMDGVEDPLPDSAVLSLEPKFALRGGIVGVETTFIFEGGRMRPVTDLPSGPCRL